MAKSGSTIVRLNSYNTLRFYWKAEYQDIASNSTRINWRLELSANGGGAIYKGVSSKSYSIWIDNIVIANGSVYPYVDANSTNVLASGSYTIKHSASGEKSFSYKFRQNFNAIIQGVTVDKIEGSGSGTLDTISRGAVITSAPSSFTDNDTPSITYSNPSGDATTSIAACISLTGAADDIPYRDVEITSSGAYTFNLTPEEISTLRNAVKTGSTVQVKFYIRSVVDDYTYYSTSVSSFVLAAPEPILAPSVIDTNARTIALTGDNRKLIRYFSNAYFDTGAQATEGATIEYQTITCGSVTLDDYTSNTGTIENVDSNTFYFSATDSRGFTTRDFVVFSEDYGEYIPYVKLTNNLKASIATASGALTFTVSGKYYNGSFGAQANSMEIEYALRELGGDIEWTRLGVIAPNVDADNNYSYSYTITSGIDYSKKYELTVNVIDELTPVQSVVTTISAIPVFDWGESDFQHNTDVYFNKNVYIDNQLVADQVIEQGASGTWFYRKWNSGRVELYGYQNISSLACNTALGGWYRTAVQSAPYFPFTVNNPKVVANYESNGTGALVWFTTRASSSAPADFYLIRPTSSTAISGVVNYMVSGTL